MLFESIQNEFVTGPIGFIASVITLVTFLLGVAVSFVRSRRPVAIAGLTLSPHLFRLIAALMWALTLSLGSGIVVGRIFTAHWLAGLFAAVIAVFVVATAIAAVAGHLAKPWINEVATMRQRPAEHQETFIGLTPLSEFVELCASGVTWLVIMATALGLAEPWWKTLASIEQSYPNTGNSVAAGLASVFSIGAAIYVGRRLIARSVITAFTAMAGIRWADTSSTSAAQPTPPPIRKATTRAAPRRKSQKDSGDAAKRTVGP